MTLDKVFDGIATVRDMGQFEYDEADDYGIDADEGFPFYTAVRKGFLLFVAHQDGEWGASIYGNHYGDCYGCEWADSADAALSAVLDAATRTII